MDIERGCWSCIGTPRSPRSRPCWQTAAAPSTARPRRSSSPRSTTAAATSRSSTSATTARSRTCRRMRSSRSRPGSIATVRIPCRSPPLAAEQRGLVQAVKAYEELTIRAATHGDRRSALLALARKSTGRRGGRGAAAWTPCSRRTGITCRASRADRSDTSAGCGSSRTAGIPASRCPRATRSAMPPDHRTIVMNRRAAPCCGPSRPTPSPGDPLDRRRTSVHAGPPAGGTLGWHRHHRLRVPGRARRHRRRGHGRPPTPSLSSGLDPVADLNKLQLPEETVIYDRTGKVELARFGEFSATSSPSTRSRRSCSTRRPRSRTRRSGRTPASTRSGIVAAGDRLPSAAPARGASTITQQLVRARLLPERTWSRTRTGTDRAQAQGDHPVASG